jgi:hypothetical protein
MSYFAAREASNQSKKGHTLRNGTIVTLPYFIMYGAQKWIIEKNELGALI